MVVPQILLVPLPDRKWRIMRLDPIGTPFAIDTTAAGHVEIPLAFVCDLNSIPRFLWWASTPTDYPQAGATHDYLYDQQVPREIADAVYLEILLALGMSSARAHARYYALRTFGWHAYRQHRKE